MFLLVQHDVLLGAPLVFHALELSLKLSNLPLALLTIELERELNLAPVANSPLRLTIVQKSLRIALYFATTSMLCRLL